MLRHNRHTIRLKGYDYAEEGGYFVTIITQGREMLFGRVVDGEMVLNEFGRIVENSWNDLINHNADIELDEFVIMPNHVHGIIVLEPSDRAGLEPAPTVLSEIVRQFKTFSARRINQLRHTPGKPVWQRNFYDHIIRDEKDYEAVVNYIYLNPQSWAKDDENPDYFC